MLNISSFSASKGWFHGFKKRYKLSHLRYSGEERSVRDEVIESELKIIKGVLEKYEAKDIYNVDET